MSTPHSPVATAAADAAASSAAAAKKKKKKGKKKPGAQLPQINGGALVAVRFSASKGRHVLAARALPAGCLFLLERAYAFVPRDAFRGRVCEHCLAPGAGVACASCNHVRYCSAGCCAAAAPAHSVECAVLPRVAEIAAAADVDGDLLRLLLRIMCARRHEEDGAPAGCEAEEDGDEEEVEGGSSAAAAPLPAAAATLTVPRYAALLGMQSHADAAAESWRAAVSSGIDRLLALVPEHARLPPAELLQHAGRINSNAHGLTAADGCSPHVGVGVFPLCSLLNHSCTPNVAFVPVPLPGAQGGVALAMRTLVPVPAGGELFLSYIDLYQGVSARRAELRATKAFDCTCTRCAAEEAWRAVAAAAAAAPAPQRGAADLRLDADGFPVPPPLVDEVSSSSCLVDALCCSRCGAGAVFYAMPSGVADSAPLASVAQAAAALGKLSLSVPSAPLLAAPGPATAPLTCKCPSCGLVVAATAGAAVQAVFAIALKQAEALVLRRLYAEAHASFEALRADFVAPAAAAPGAAPLAASPARLSLAPVHPLFVGGIGVTTPPLAAPGVLSDPGAGFVRLHPQHARVVNALIPAALAATAAGEGLAALRSHRAYVAAMQGVLPAHHPELASARVAAARAAEALLDSGRLPKKTAVLLRAEAVSWYREAHVSRALVLGETNDAVKEVMRLSAAAVAKRV